MEYDLGYHFVNGVLEILGNDLLSLFLINFTYDFQKFCICDNSNLPCIILNSNLS